MPTPEPRPRRRRWPWVLALGLATALIGWQVLERALRVDQYRPQLAQALERQTGLPVAIGRLALALRPVPCLSALDVSIGEGDLHAQAARVDVYVALRELLFRRLVISRIAIGELSLTLPASGEEIGNAWSELLANLEAAGDGDEPPDPDPTFVTFAARRVDAEHAALRFGAESAAPLAVSFVAKDLAGDAMRLELEASVPSLDVSAGGALEIPLGDGAEPGLRGEILLRELRPDRIVALPPALHAAWSARLALEPGDGGDTRLVLDGRFEPAHEDALAGRLAATGRIRADGGLDFEAELQGGGLSLRGSGEQDGERTALRIEALEARAAALRALLAALGADPEEGWQLAARPDAALALRSLEVVLPSDAPAVLAGGVLEAQGIEPRWRGEPLVEPLRIDAQVDDGGVRIDRVEGGALALTGRLDPGAGGWSQARLALRGTLQLGDELLRPLGAPASLEQVRGRVAIEELRASFGNGSGGDLALRARLSDGSLRLASEAFSDRISQIDLVAANRNGSLRVEGGARSEAMGRLGLEATIEPAKSLARGQLTLDAGAAAALLADAGTRKLAEPLLQTYGPSRIGFVAEWPEADTKLQLERAGAPKLSARLALRGAGGGLGDVALEADVPAAGLRGALPAAARASGAAALRLTRSEADGRFALDADLGPLGLAFGEYVEKRPGEPLRLAVKGRADDDVWQAERLELLAPDATLGLGLGETGVAAPELDVDLAAWSFLLVDGAHASGRIRGAIDPTTASTRLRLDAVALRLTPELALESADGEVAREGDDWSVRELRLRGAGTDAVLDATLVGGRIEGRLAGAQLDVDLVRALLDEVSEIAPEGDPDAPPAVRSGQLAVRLDRVGLQRGEARALVAILRWQEGDLQVRDLAFETYQGRVTGTVDVGAREGAPSQLGLDLDIQGVTGRFLDDMLAAEPRGVTGTFSGKLRFEAPLHDDVRALLAGASGSLEAQGKQGSFGRLGLATRLTTVLRSTETLRLRLPTLRDEGLVFDTVDAALTMQDGRIEIGEFVLDSTTYAVTAGGYLDFRKDKSRVPIEFNAIKGLTSILQYIPVAGETLDIVNVRLTGTGSPYHLQIGIASVKDQLIGAGMVGPKAVVGGARGVYDLLRRVGGGARTTRESTGPGETAPAEPTPAAEPEIAEPTPSPPDAAASEGAEPAAPDEPVEPPTEPAPAETP